MTIKREWVLFHVVGQGGIEIEYDDEEETALEVFRGIYDELKFGSLIRLARDARDFDFVLTSSVEPK